MLQKGLNVGLRTILGLKKPKSVISATLAKSDQTQAVKTFASITNAERIAATRRDVLSIVPKGGVGAELGVFTGAYSKVLFEETSPSKFFLVDVWHTKYGEFYPSWGEYTDFGKLTTEAALSNVRGIVEGMKGTAEIVISPSIEWLSSLPTASLDWVYLDTTHSYEDTLAELTELSRVMRPSGLILGDDCQINPNLKHHAVFRAVRDFCSKGSHEIIYMDRLTQWAIRQHT